MYGLTPGPIEALPVTRDNPIGGWAAARTAGCHDAKPRPAADVTFTDRAERHRRAGPASTATLRGTRAAVDHGPDTTGFEVPVVIGAFDTTVDLIYTSVPVPAEGLPGLVADDTVVDAVWGPYASWAWAATRRAPY